MVYKLDNVKAVIFDMDGVLFNTEQIYLDVWTKVFHKYGYKMTKEVYCEVIGTGRENVKKVFMKEFGEDIPIEEMYKEKDELLFRELKKSVPLKEGAYELLKYLKNQNYKLALGTSALRERMENQLRKANFIDIFDTVVCREDVKETKPNPETFLRASEKLGVEPNECVVIEDSSAGIIAAYKGGMIPIHVVDLKAPDKEIEKYCYKSFNDLLEIKREIFND